MARNEILSILKSVRKEIQKAQKRFEESHKSANEIAVSSAGSPSQSGDRLHSRNQAEINKDVLEHLIIEERDLSNSLNIKPTEVKSPCYVELQEENGLVKKLYYLNNALNLVGFKTVSSESPIGKLLLGKKIGCSVNIFSTRSKIININ